MKDALMSFLESLKTRGLLNSMYSMEELNRFFSTPESKELQHLFMEDFMTKNTFFEWLHDLKEYVRYHMATLSDASNIETLSDAPNIDCEIFTSSAEVKSGGTPEGQTGHQLIRFLVDKRFVAKEVAVVKNGSELTYHIFTCPMPWRFLTKADQSHASWVMTHHHGLRWNDGMVPYRTAQRLISEAVSRESGAIVKGFEKRGWLLDILNNDDVIVETIDMHYGEIESLKTLDAINTYRCGRHSKCCALQNVLKLFNQWTRFQSK
ncbi:hypothetical protein ALC57_12101 [Trachymyrmex cornetzi]|uniref:Uncharacterized protein n=1 Tax=Trachymyrmex cornetzi TaxID=471704 RepID=A0A151J1G5_9HYME|nr:hypothetical protein ALC57_12101 [Trachymyrmex cornetzi]